MPAAILQAALSAALGEANERVAPIDGGLDVLRRVREQAEAGAPDRLVVVFEFVHIPARAPVDERRERHELRAVFAQHHWHAKFDGCEDSVVAKELVFTVAAYAVQATEAELLGGKKRLIAELRVGADDEQRFP